MRPVANIALSNSVPLVDAIDVYYDPSDGRVTIGIRTGGAWVGVHLKTAERAALIAALSGAESAPLVIKPHAVECAA